MIIRVIEHLGRITAGDDTSGPTVGCARGLHGVFAVIAARLLRKAAFAVLEDAAVAIVRQRPAALDRIERGDSLGREKVRITRRLGRLVDRGPAW